MGFKEYSKERKKDYLVIINSGYSSIEIKDITGNSNRFSLLSCNTYISYNIKQDYIANANNFITKYKIIEKFMDTYDNLFLVAESENYDI